MIARSAAILAGLFLFVGCTPSADDPSQKLEYPETVTVDHVDVHHGVEVADPYRWLEDDVRESQDVKSWVDAQNEVTFAYLATIGEREAIKRRLTELWDFERFGLPVKKGGRYF